ncbi:hypothetical protein ACFLU5_04830 [Bacteroidota bacterium]
MKKFKQKIWLSVLAVAISGTMALADVFTVSNDPTIPAQYTNLTDALAVADDGDTLLVKATRNSYSTVNLTQPITIIGEGFYPNKDISRRVYLSISIRSGSENSTLLGVNGSISTYTTSGQQVNNINIERCVLTSCLIYGSNWVIKHCIMDGNIHFYNVASNVSITNCIFKQYNSYLSCENTSSNSNVLINNNVFFNYHASFQFSNNLNNTIVSNNIFYGRSPSDQTGFSDVTFLNNLSYGAPDNTFPDDAPNGVYSTDNLENEDPKFVTDGIPTDEDFSLDGDIHLQDGFPAKTGASDGGQIGIYGGPDPWPEFDASVPHMNHPIPPIPMVQRMHILNTPTKDGTLKVKVKAKAVD